MAYGAAGDRGLSSPFGPDQLDLTRAAGDSGRAVSIRARFRSVSAAAVPVRKTLPRANADAGANTTPYAPAIYRSTMISVQPIGRQFSI
jgi:hypothetical protein